MSSEHGTPETVFICHSHADRHMAVRLQKIIEAHGVRTFLDQDRIEPLDNLPESLEGGIRSAGSLLLLWSADAATSDWVQREWQTAHKAGKRVIPYVLDATPLPFLLDELVYIDRSDLEHGNAALLEVIGARPGGRDVFPGVWEASVDVSGLVQGTYSLELRANGQVEGSGGIGNTGVAASMASELGVGSLLDMRVPVHGSWSYDDRTHFLTIDVIAEALGQQRHDTIRIHATGYEHGAMSGEDLGGRQWTLRRIGERPGRRSASSPVEAEKERVRDALQAMIDRGRDSPTLPVTLAAACVGAQQQSQYDLGLPTKRARRVLEADEATFPEAWRDFARALERGHWIS